MNMPEFSITILDVGHGNSSVIREGSTIVVIDVGARSDLLEFLNEGNVSCIDLVLISHSDADHIGGLIGLLAAGIQIKRIRLNSDAEKESEAWRDLVITLEDSRRRGELQFEVGLSSGPIAIDGLSRCSAEIVAPTPEIIAFGAGGRDRYQRRITSNTISTCIRIDFDGKPTALLTGDMDEISLDSCIEAKANLTAPILVFPHHGGLPGGSDCKTFANKLITQCQPDRVFFSIGRNKFENPRPEAVDVAKKHGAYIACTQLSKHCADENENFARSNVASAYSAGMSKGHCCAGTVTIDLEAASLFSTHSKHTQFIALLKKAICL